MLDKKLQIRKAHKDENKINMITKMLSKKTVKCAES